MPLLSWRGIAGQSVSGQKTSNFHRQQRKKRWEKQVFALSQLRMPFQHHTHFPEAFNDSLQVVQLANISWPLNKRQNNNLNELR